MWKGKSKQFSKSVLVVSGRGAICNVARGILALKEQKRPVREYSKVQLFGLIGVVGDGRAVDVK